MIKNEEGYTEVTEKYNFTGDRWHPSLFITLLPDNNRGIGY